MHEDLPNNPGVVHHYTAEILSTTEQYRARHNAVKEGAFSMEMPGRSFSVEDYRYGMNGQEKSDEIFKGVLTAEFWEYDSRIGRRWNMDPVDYSWQSPYTCFNNNPFYFADPFGLEGEKVLKGDGYKAAGTKLTEEGDAWSNGDGSTESSNNKSICYACGANGENSYGLPPESDLGETASVSPRVDSPLKNGGFKSDFSKSNFKSNFSINLANSHVKTFKAKASIVHMEIKVPELKIRRANVNGDPTGIIVRDFSTANGWFDKAVGLAEVSTLAGQGKYKTSKGLIRDINFKKLTKNSAPYATANKIIKSWGRGSAVLGFVFDGYAYRNNQISGIHFGVNTGITAWGLGLGAAGMAVPAFIGGALYFGIDTFYPGGMDGAMQKNGSLIEQNQQILGPGFNLYKDH
jgi:hypothetical protein